MNDKSSNRKTPDSFASSFSSSANKPANDFDDILSRLKMACGVNSDKKLSEKLGITYSAITAARKRNTIPPVWYVTVFEKSDVSMDWLHTGEGEMKRSVSRYAWTNVGLERQDKPGIEAPGPLRGDETCVPPTKAATGVPALGVEAQCDYLCGNAPTRREISIADMLAKTARVLESDTVYREALYSNIEAFHHGVTMDERLSKMDSKFDQVTHRLDALEAENQQLRQELEQSRAGSALSDTG